MAATMTASLAGMAVCRSVIIIVVEFRGSQVSDKPPKMAKVDRRARPFLRVHAFGAFSAAVPFP